MATRLKKFKDMLISNKIKIINVICVILLAYSVVLTVIIAGGIPYYFYPVRTAILFVSVAILLVRLSFLIANIIKKKNSKKKIEERYKSIAAAEGIAAAAAVLYTAIVMTVLIKGNRDGYSYISELISYNMEWVLVLMLAVPVLSFCIPFFCLIKKAAFELMNGLDDIEFRMNNAVSEKVKSERMKMDLITNVSHDLKTPLTSVIGYIALMKKEDMSDVLKDYLEVLSDKTDVLKKMIETVFDLAKVSSGSARFNMEKLDLNCLTKQITADMQDIIEEKQKTVKLVLEDNPLYIYADNIYMYRIFQNLIENAIKYSMDKTRIFIKTYTKDERAFFEIINVSNYPLDFDISVLKERFVRADESRNSEGNGLGLAIVEAYTGALEGEFTISTEADLFKAAVSFRLAE